MFDSILVANRGEIARRVFRTARQKGYRSIAVYSEVDADAPHTQDADIAACIGGAVPAQSYLNIEAVLEAARKTGAQAIHPGYGFLAENAEFAEACEAAGLVFVGPPAEAIRLMGSKRLSKLRMIEAGVPCVPGYSGEDQSTETLATEAARIGVPLMIKASAGGGGRGLRLVEDLDGLMDKLVAAASEAVGAFGNGELILEKAVINPRHVEIQVFADNHGNVVHLGERDCSVQRRHQKVIEEAPGPSVTPEIRNAMGEAAVEAARAIGYRGAGTVEFLLAADGSFYFMEMNTRLQVEHPVTEEITGQDLVAWQLDVAAGKPLPLSQDEVTFSGHAMELRLYAEDADAGFLPQTGKVVAWNGPELALRVDSAIEQGSVISSYYDPMIAKLIAHGADRDEARRKLMRGLDQLVLQGVVHNGPFLKSVLADDVFASGQATTAFLNERDLSSAAADETRELMRDLAIHLFARQQGHSRWTTATPLPVKIKLDGEEMHVREGLCLLGSEDRGSILFELEGVRRTAFVSDADEGGLWISLEGQTQLFEEQSFSTKKDDASAVGNFIIAPMPGAVIALKTKQGAQVSKGDVLLVLEAMKMQHELTAPRDGIVAELGTKEGAQVNSRDVLVRLEDETA
ncbi:biotin carboxylase N-terminal domain-containing protein [Pseudovibrio sp. Tun.PSC04-5.I4]|uniref:ATP-binding protein n=1 Tax=Pseudovibrio sp. Tun.PSC04-5.I4 TaxID=1798213 RepID=UPI0008865398|nr:biotin carboxylase N-terminal domain-containing protein [Pseudovibrio sp. Tun.PSC04-5.I4]SDR33386.1 geranyl-CoA carboxylase alpha subunit [Pseudovibrio sp. Tun.PSC04-5.I4]